MHVLEHKGHLFHPCNHRDLQTHENIKFSRNDLSELTLQSLSEPMAV